MRVNVRCAFGTYIVSGECVCSGFGVSGEVRVTIHLFVTLQKEQAVERLRKTHMDKVGEQAKVSLFFASL